MRHTEVQKPQQSDKTTHVRRVVMIDIATMDGLCRYCLLTHMTHSDAIVQLLKDGLDRGGHMSKEHYSGREPILS